MTTLAGLAGQSGSADGVGSNARFNFPAGIAVDNNGNLFVSDSGNNTIRSITSAGVVTTIGGVAGQSGSIDGIANLARFNNPTGIAVDVSGNIYVAEYNNSTVRTITSVIAPTITTQPQTQTVIAGSNVTLSCLLYTSDAADE